MTDKNDIIETIGESQLNILKVCELEKLLISQRIAGAIREKYAGLAAAEIESTLKSSQEMQQAEQKLRKNLESLQRRTDKILPPGYRVKAVNIAEAKIIAGYSDEAAKEDEEKAKRAAEAARKAAEEADEIDTSEED